MQSCYKKSAVSSQHSGSKIEKKIMQGHFYVPSKIIFTTFSKKTLFVPTIFFSSFVSDCYVYYYYLLYLFQNLYIETRDLVVTEGKETSLTSANIHVITDYFVDKINDYLIVDPPTSGRLVAINNEQEVAMAKAAPAVTIFSVDDLEKQRIRVS